MIDLYQKESIGYIVLNRPEKRNALDLEALIELDKVLKGIKRNRSQKVLIIKGKGLDFCSGHDLTEFVNKQRSIHHFRKIFSLSAQIMQAFHTLPQPIIAQVHGHATAAGCQLVAACDLAIAEKDSLFSTPGVKLGLFCSTPMVSLTRSIGRKHALEMLFTGKEITANEAKQLGLINSVVEKDKLQEETENLATEITQFSGKILALGKQAFYQQINHLESDAYHLSKEVIALNCLFDEAQEGITAMLEKRKPQWKNDLSEQN
jgi:enoyl-CoA hydratase/carnithine racemase